MRDSQKDLWQGEWKTKGLVKMEELSLWQVFYGLIVALMIKFVIPLIIAAVITMPIYLLINRFLTGKWGLW